MDMIIRANRPGMLNEHHTCPECIIPVCKGEEVCNEMIPEFYGEQTAKDAGWIKTSHPDFCPPNKEWVWICPDCIKADGRRWVQK